MNLPDEEIDSREVRFCPKCNGDWQGEPIPEERSKYFGGRTHFSRLTGIYFPEYDRTMVWRCPDCSAEFRRLA